MAPAAFCFTLLCVCLALKGGLGIFYKTSPTSLKVTRAERKWSSDNQTVTLIASFEAASQPDIHWWAWHRGTEDLNPGAVATIFNGAGKTSTTQIDVDASVYDGSMIYLDIGHVPSQFFKLGWDLYYKTDKSTPLSLTTATVSPGLDLTYAPGQQVSTDIVVDGENWDSTVYLTGYFLEGDSNEITIMEEDRTLLELDFKVSGGKTKTSAKFFTDTRPISGYFFGSTYGSVDDYEAPITEIEESFTVLVHNTTTAGPFPAGFIALDFEKDEKSRRKLCWISQSCYIGCSAYANSFQSLEIVKVAADGTKISLSNGEIMYNPNRPYQYTYMVNLPGGQAKGGDYMCIAIDQNNNMALSTLEIVDK